MLSYLVVLFLSGFACVSANIDYPHGISNTTINYPEKNILKAISDNKSFLSTMLGDVFRPEIHLADRSNGGKGENICPSRQITYKPKSGKNISNVIKNIVNVDGYVQFVTVEICEDNAESSIACHMPAGYKFRCKTQHVTIRLAVYNEDGTITFDNFSIPSGCACTYEYA